jgi:DNA-binding transcriptional ArsR family regulator
LTAAAKLDGILAALADPHRRRVIDLLSERPRRASELAKAAGLSPPAMSRHLRSLRQAGLVEETERLWAQQLAAFKAHLERGP